jgi:hypothetical protein
MAETTTYASWSGCGWAAVRERAEALKATASAVGRQEETWEELEEEAMVVEATAEGWEAFPVEGYTVEMAALRCSNWRNRDHTVRRERHPRIMGHRHL